MSRYYLHFFIDIEQYLLFLKNSRCFSILKSMVVLNTRDMQNRVAPSSRLEIFSYVYRVTEVLRKQKPGW